MIKRLHDHGVYQKDIAKELGVHARTVSRALKRDGAPAARFLQRLKQLIERPFVLALPEI